MIAYKGQGYRRGYTGQGGVRWRRDATSQGLPRAAVLGRWPREGTALQKTSARFVPCDGKA